MKKVNNRKHDQGRLSDAEADRMLKASVTASNFIEPTGKRRARGRGQMIAFANRVEKSLSHHDALPRRKKDRCIIGDLAELDLRLFRLRRILDALVAGPKSVADRRPFDQRLMALAAEIDSAHAVLRDLKRPVSSLLKQRCGLVGLAAAGLLGAHSSLDGLSKR